MEIPEREPMLSLDQAARYLQKSYSWLYANFRRLDIPVYRIGGRWYFERIDIDRWLSEQKYAGYTYPHVVSARGGRIKL